MTNVWLQELGAHASAVAAADRAGLLALLGEEAVTAEEAASRLGLDARAAALVLEVLASAGVAIARGGRYEASDALREALRDELAEPGRNTALWMGTEAFLRTGASVPRLGDREEVYARFVHHLGRMFEVAARHLADALVPELPASPSVLDVGAGSGVWSLAVAAAAKGRATAIDLAPVLGRFAERAAAMGLADRVATIAGDYHRVPVEQGRYDAVIFANVLHLESAAGASSMIARIAPAVRSGGKVVVVDMIGDGTPGASRIGAAYALHLALRVPGSRVHPRADLEDWLASAGCVETRRVAFARAVPGMAALIATRR